MTDDKNIHEDAKSDWMKLVKKHKKKQKGLPALSRLNTNAGNVEHNIKMFNTAATPVDGPSNNPISGPFGGDVSGGMCESLIDINPDKIVLNYTQLPVEVATDIVIPATYYEPEEVVTKDIELDYSYKVSKDEVIYVLSELPQIKDRFKSLTDEEYDAIIASEFENLVREFEEEILDAFEPSVIKHIEETYVYHTKDDYPEYDSYDDEFDMSVRTLL